MLRHLRGHLLTVAPTLRHRILPEPAPPSRPWQTAVADPVRGPVTIFGHLHEHPGADRLLVVVHGLGGSPESYYMRRAATTAWRAGMSCLRVGLRGTARTGEDYYHAGLTADIHAALAAPELARYRRIFVLGYSMGGHASLRLAAEDHDPRIAAVATVCAPLDLAAIQADMDRRRSVVYRRYLLHHLCDIYCPVALRHGGPVRPEEARGIRTFRAWDDRVMAPRWGFADAADYYHQTSAMHVLDQLRVPTLFLAEKRDPMVTAHSLVPHLSRPYPGLTVRWIDRGGHVGFPHLGVGPWRDRSVEAEIVDWLSRAAPSP